MQRLEPISIYRNYTIEEESKFWMVFSHYYQRFFQELKIINDALLEVCGEQKVNDALLVEYGYVLEREKDFIKEFLIREIGYKNAKERNFEFTSTLQKQAFLVTYQGLCDAIQDSGLSQIELTMKAFELI